MSAQNLSLEKSYHLGPVNFDFGVSQSVNGISASVPGDQEMHNGESINSILRKYITGVESHYSIVSTWKSIRVTPTSGTRDWEQFRKVVYELTLDPAIKEKRAELVTSYVNEKTKYRHLLESGNSELLDKVFSGLLELLLRVSFEKIAFEITRDQALFVVIRLSNKTKAHLKVKLKSGNDGISSAFFAVYSGHNCILSETGPASVILSKARQQVAKLP